MNRRGPYTAEEIHERLSNYFEMCPLTGQPADAFPDPLDFLCHETWKRRVREGAEEPLRLAEKLDGELGTATSAMQTARDLIRSVRFMAVEAAGSGPTREWVLGAWLMRAEIVKRLNAEAYRGSANLVERLALPTPDGRRYRVTVRALAMCTRCGHEAEAMQPGKPDEFTCLVLDCHCHHAACGDGSCAVAAS